MKTLWFGLIAGIVVILAAMVVMRPRPASTPDYFIKTSTLEQALADQGATGKPVIAFFTADWCGPCQVMKRTSLADPRVADLMRTSFTPIYVDMTHTGDPVKQELAKRFGVRAFPTLLILQGEKQVARTEGGPPVDQLVAWLKDNAG